MHWRRIGTYWDALEMHWRHIRDTFETQWRRIGVALRKYWCNFRLFILDFGFLSLTYLQTSHPLSYIYRPFCISCPIICSYKTLITYSQYSIELVTVPLLSADLLALAQFSGVLHLSVFHQASHRVQGSRPSSLKIGAKLKLNKICSLNFGALFSLDIKRQQNSSYFVKNVISIFL